MAKMIRGYKKEDFSSPSIIFKLDISIYAKMTYLYLQMLLDVEGNAMPSHAEIGHYISASKSSAKRAVKELEEIGLIQVIHRKKNEKENDSNLYIVYHPKQIEGLKMLPDYEEIKYQKKKKKPAVTQTTPSETCGHTDPTQKPMFTQTLPPETYGQTDHTPSEKTSNIKGFEETYGQTDQDTTNRSIEDIEEVEVEEEDIVVTAVEKIKLAYKKYLKGEISTQQAESFLEVGLNNNMTLDDIIAEIKYIAENVTIKWNAPGTVYTSLSDGGWSKQPNQFQQNKTKNQKRKVTRLPKAVEEQLKQEQNGSQNQQTLSEEELAERRRRIQEKIKLMDEKLSSSAQTEKRTQEEDPYLRPFSSF